MTDFTMVRSSSSPMARSAASARSSMLMAWIIRVPRQQIFTFATHRLHRGRRSSACAGRETPRRNHSEEERAMTRRTVQRLTAVALTAQAIRAAVTEATVAVPDPLTPAQRQVVANYARTFGPFGRR